MKIYTGFLSLILLCSMVGGLLITNINQEIYYEISEDADPAENTESENEEPVKEKEKYDELYYQTIISANSKLSKTLSKWLLSNAHPNNLPIEVISPPPEFMFLEC